MATRWNTMFETVEITNFKSIVRANVELSPLTVIVGANGSGKSNLIKALEFLASVPRIGLVATVNRFGGFQALVPKAIPTEELKKTRIAFVYQCLLPKLKGYSADLPPLAVRHELELAHAEKESIRVTGEKVIYRQPLAIAEVIGSDYDEEVIDPDLLKMRSAFLLERGPRGGVKYSSDPPLADAIPGYLGWLGLAFAQDSIRSVTALREALKSMVRTRRQRVHTVDDSRQRYESFLDPDVPTVVDYASQAQMYLAVLSAVRRYDLLLSELRPEQQVSEAAELSTAGSNMPSVLRHIRSTSEASLTRILRTLSSITPHIVSMKPSSLRSGKEFIEFVESTASRGVESWESSDGTLRALAILLALETHRPYSTVLIEEPEQNLHPWAVREVIEHVREVIDERHVQVVMTTHSQQVLEQVYPEEVLVATRSDEQGTEFRTLKEILPQSEIVMGEVGDLWVKGLLGGVPSDECY
jgi:predicted ATPase